MVPTQTPMYVQVIQWVDAIVGIVYPIALVIILSLAYLQFKKLVRSLVPEDKKVAKIQPAEKVEEKA